jgi:hypothetical protein
MITFAPSMKTMNKTLVPVLEIALKESLKNYELKSEGDSLSDLYLYHDVEENILFIYDNKETILNEISLPKEQIFNTISLRFVLQQMEQAQIFNKECYVKPFVISMVDRDFIVMEEVFCIDDELVKFRGDMWRNIERDLDEFMKNLLK